MGGIYEVRVWDVFKWHAVRTEFRGDRSVLMYESFFLGGGIHIQSMVI
jgi:hypothetical protein